MKTSNEIISQFESEMNLKVNSIRVIEDIVYFNTEVGAYSAKLNSRGIAKNSIRIDNN